MGIGQDKDKDVDRDLDVDGTGNRSSDPRHEALIGAGAKTGTGTGTGVSISSLVRHPLPPRRPGVGAADWAAICILSLFAVGVPLRSLAVSLLASGVSGEGASGMVLAPVDAEVATGAGCWRLSRGAAAAGEWPGAVASGALGWPALVQGSGFVAAFMTVALG